MVIPETQVPGAQLDKPLDDIIGPGEQLRAARMARNLSTAEVATRLRLDVKHIEAIERDEFPHFMAPVFARGYLRNYAKLLNLPTEPIVESYNSQHCELPPLLYTRPAGSAVQSGDHPVSWVIYVAFLAVLFIGFVWWQTQGTFEFGKTDPGIASDAQAVHEQILQPAIPTAVVTTPVKPVSIADVISTQGTERKLGSKSESLPDMLRTIAQPVRADLSSLSLPPTEITVPPVAPSGSSIAIASPMEQIIRQALTESRPLSADGTVVLRLSDESSVEVTDRNGKKIVSGVLAAGTTQALPVPNFPLKMLLGKAAAVSIEYNGKVLDHAIYDRATGVTRLTLNKAGKLERYISTPPISAENTENTTVNTGSAGNTNSTTPTGSTDGNPGGTGSTQGAGD